MPNAEWPVVPLSQILERIEAGKSPLAQERPANPDEWGVLKVSAVTWGRFQPQENKALLAGTDPKGWPTVKKGDLLISRANTTELVGAAVLVADDHPRLLLSDKTLRLVPKEDIGYAPFLLYALRTNDVRTHFEQTASGTSGSMRNISQEKLGAAQIPLPPLAEQRRIAEVLDRAEALRAKRRAALAELDSLTQSLFLDLFGDPVTNPKSWPLQMLGNVTEMITGYPFRSEEYVTNEASVRLCRGANVLPGRLDWSDLARWPMSKADGLEDFRLRVGDVVIAMDRPWISEGFKIASVQDTDCPSLLVQRVARLRGGKHLPNEFLFYLLKQPAFTRHCRPTETTIPHISPKDIRSFSFPLPPIALQQEFARRVGAVEKLKAAQRTALAEQDALFATLQHRAFRGEL